MQHPERHTVWWPWGLGALFLVVFSAALVETFGLAGGEPAVTLAADPGR
ncbi:MAG: hypothetical protein ACTS11_00415 [Roseicyclus sp.]